MISSTKLKNLTPIGNGLSTRLFGREKPKRHPQGTLHRKLHTYVPSTKLTLAQENLESYLGGSDADVDVPLKRFQDALAYALF